MRRRPDAYAMLPTMKEGYEMVMNTITTATRDEGAVVSFGSGDSNGRLQARAQGNARNSAASPRAVSALRGRINRANITRAERRRLLNALDLQAHPRTGRTRTGSLASVDAELRDLLF